MTLTKKFRVVYNDQNEIIIDPFQEYDENSKTIVPSVLNGYEAQLKTTIEKFISDNNLIYKKEEENK